MNGDPNKHNKKPLKVALVSPFPPAFGGMATLATALQKSLEKQLVKITPINTNPAVGSFFKASKSRKIIEGLIFVTSLRKISKCNAAIIISSSGDYFFMKALPALYACRLFRCKSILDFVGGGIVELSEKEKSRLFIKIKKFDLLIVPSGPFKEFFAQAGVPSTLFPHIVDVEKFHPVEKQLRNPVFLSAKNLEEHSNIGSIIKVFALIQQQFPEACLLITGNGPQKEYLKNLARELKVTNIDFLESISDHQMIGIYEKSTILLHATRIESFGITIVEALASGTPVVSTNVGGIPDIIKDGVNGYLIDYNDHITMAEKTIYLLNNRSVYDRFVAEGLKTAQLYSSAFLGPKLKTLLEEITSRA